MPERTMLQFLARVELVNAIAAVAMTIGLVVACFLLDASYRRLGVMQAQLEQRNALGARALQQLEKQSAQGAESLKLLLEAARRLER
jgi:hypothetical protein